jgi:hypothetical protein
LEEKVAALINLDILVDFVHEHIGTGHTKGTAHEEQTRTKQHPEKK